ncbi:MAG TPA: DUF6438 domain-containing protein [Verrucomicrobiae bacterium]|jgi:hypothetical protein
MKSVLAILVLVFAVRFCAGGELQKSHAAQSKGDATNVLGKFTAAEITEVGLERTPCFGTCPIYSVIFAKDGTVRYHGGRFAARTNDWTGRISGESFAEVAPLIAESFPDFVTRYFTPITDHSTVLTMVAANGKRKVISNYANSGPDKLKQIEKRLTDLLATVKWNEPALKKEPIQ